MSSYTNFDVSTSIAYDKEASEILGADYWRNYYSFRYYVGALGSNRWIDVPAGYLISNRCMLLPTSAFLPVWGPYGQAMILRNYLCEHYTCTRKLNGGIILEYINREEVDQIFEESLLVLGVKKWKLKIVMFIIDCHRYIKNPSRPSLNLKKRKLESHFKGW